EERAPRGHCAGRAGRGAERRGCSRDPAAAGRQRAHRRRAHASRTRGRRRGGDPVGHLRARAERPADRVGDDRATVARRRVPPLRRPLLRLRGGGGVTALNHTRQVALRYVRAMVRQPAWVGITLVQPVMWLLLFGAVFKRAADIPGFTGGSYIEFLTPGIVVMLAVSSAGWVGMGFIEDISRGTMDRLLVSPIWRGALNLGRVAGWVGTIAVQTLIVIGLAMAVGARFSNGVAGVAVLVLLAALLGAVFASLSNGVAVLTRQRETLIGIVTMVTLPLVFLS